MAALINMNDPVLRLYVDRALRVVEVPAPLILHPFVGSLPDSGEPYAGRFEEYAAAGARWFALSDAQSADIYVYPNVYDHVADRTGEREKITAFLDRAAAAGKPALFFSGIDSEDTLPLGDAWQFRTSIRRSRRSPRECAVPAWHEDFVQRYFAGVVPIRAKQPIPVIGFCGYVPRYIDRVRDLWFGLAGRELRVQAGYHARVQAVESLRRSRQVTCNFLIRDDFWNGALKAPDRVNRLHAARRDFVHNLVESDYVLCVRGAGNFSYRLYEAMSCGRIPVFVDTDCVLSYEDAIDWRGLCVWVDESEIPRVGRKIADFHAALTDREFEQRQHDCRRIWSEWLSPLGFHANLHRYFMPPHLPFSFALTPAEP